MTVGESSVHEKKIREVLDVYDLSDGNFKEVLNRLIGPGKKISTPTIHNLPKTHTRFGIIGDLHLNAKSEEGGYGCVEATLFLSGTGEEDDRLYQVLSSDFG